MLWNDFVLGLDRVRVRVRNERNLKADADLRQSDSIIDELYQLLNGKNIAAVPVASAAPLPPNPPPPARKERPVRISRGEGEGTLVVHPREGGYVSKPVDLVEVSEEEAADAQ